MDDPLAAYCAAHAPVTQSCRFTCGTVFGEWRITAFIGRGGSGEVYCAEHVLLGTPAAVKVLARDDERAKARFTREAALLAKLNSAAFPSFLASGFANGSPYLAMELLEPGDLPTGDRSVARFMLKVCDAVAELHSLGYIHRDIKPSNILWRSGMARHPATADGRARSPSAPHLVAYPVLADLGLIKEISSPSAEHQTSNIKLKTLTLGGVGTPGYGAPEQMERGEATAASDIHALGVLADKCFGGKPPRAWKRIIERATSSLPERRYQSVSDFARAIRRRNIPRIAAVFLVVAGFLGVVAACSFALRASVDEEALKWRAMCRRGEIVSIEERNEPVSPDRPYPAAVRKTTNRVDGTIVQLPEKVSVFSRAISLASGEYRIVGPGRLDADISGPTNVIVRLSNCILNNMTGVPYPQNGIHYVLEGGAYLNFARLDKGLLPIKHVVIEDGAKNALRFRGPTIISELRDLEGLEEKRSWEDGQTPRY